MVPGILLSLAGGHFALKHTIRTESVTITEKKAIGPERFIYGKNSNNELVVMTVTNNWLLFQTNANSLYDKLQVSKTYNLEVAGYMSIKSLINIK